MPHNVVHFAIHGDDLERARRFYEKVFGWQFRPYGPADFFQIATGSKEEPGILGALQSRRYSMLPREILGYECSVSVDDVDATVAAVEAHGGKVVIPKTAIPGVGWLVKFLDTEGNLVCAIRFDQNAA